MECQAWQKFGDLRFLLRSNSGPCSSNWAWWVFPDHLNVPWYLLGHGLPAVTVKDMFPTSKFLRSWNNLYSSNIKKWLSTFDGLFLLFFKAFQGSLRRFFSAFFFKVVINFNASKSFNKSHLKFASSQITKINSGNLHLLWAEKLLSRLLRKILTRTDASILTYEGFYYHTISKGNWWKKLALSISIQIVYLLVSVVQFHGPRPRKMT